MNKQRRSIAFKPLLARLFAAAALVGVMGQPMALPGAPTPPDIAAKAYILQDFNSHRVLAQHNADERMEPASLTKMMTTYVVAQELAAGNINQDDMVRISEKAWRMPGSRMFVEVGSQVSVKELLKGVVIQSGNDASVALAEYVAGSEEAFASLMNSYARELGMTSTHFVNATGLPDPQHYTTAGDMATLAAGLIRDFPEHYALYRVKEYTYNGIRQFNRNKLLWQDQYVDGVKTGHTESAGYCLVSSAERDGMRLVSVVLGTKNENARATESQKLLTYGFRFFETHKLYDAQKALTAARIWKGEQEKLPLGLAETLYITIPRGRYRDLEASMSVDSLITAPAPKGRAFGTVNVTLDGDPLIERELVSLEAVSEGGLWRSLVDEIRLVFE